MALETAGLEAVVSPLREEDDHTVNREVDAPARERQNGMVETPAVRHLLLNRRTTFTIDLLVMVAAFWVSYLLRFDFQVPGVHRQHAVYQLPLVLAVQFAALYVSGALAFVWKYVGMTEVSAFIRAGAGRTWTCGGSWMTTR